MKLFFKLKRGHYKLASRGLLDINDYTRNIKLTYTYSRGKEPQATELLKKIVAIIEQDHYVFNTQEHNSVRLGPRKALNEE
jgi:hypothetical protein